jgi:hypothetical protein
MGIAFFMGDSIKDLNIQFKVQGTAKKENYMSGDITCLREKTAALLLLRTTN